MTLLLAASFLAAPQFTVGATTSSGASSGGGGSGGGGSGHFAGAGGGGGGVGHDRSGGWSGHGAAAAAHAAAAQGAAFRNQGTARSAIDRATANKRIALVGSVNKMTDTVKHHHHHLRYEPSNELDYFPGDCLYGLENSYWMDCMRPTKSTPDRRG